MSSLRQDLSRASDLAIEALLPLSFSTYGYRLRERVLDWPPLPRLEGRWILLTGGTSGLGREAVTNLAASGANVIFSGRSAQRANEVLTQVREGGGSAHFIEGDLADHAAVEALATTTATLTERLDVLIHNGGTLSRAFTLSPQGHELTGEVHLVAPFALTSLLLPLLVRGTGEAPSRVITMTSGGMYGSRFSISELDRGAEEYNGVKMYSSAKRAQTVLMIESARRLGDSGIRCHSVHPGWADTPGLADALPGFYKVLRGSLRTPRQGVDTLLWLCGATAAEEHNGALWFDRAPRSMYYVPGTRPREIEAIEQGRAIWQWCAQRLP